MGGTLHPPLKFPVLLVLKQIERFEGARVFNLAFFHIELLEMLSVSVIEGYMELFTEGEEGSEIDLPCFL